MYRVASKFWMSSIPVRDWSLITGRGEGGGGGYKTEGGGVTVFTPS